jgi:hypothetical protein
LPHLFPPRFSQALCLSAATAARENDHVITRETFFGDLRCFYQGDG